MGILRKAAKAARWVVFPVDSIVIKAAEKLGPKIKETLTNTDRNKADLKK